MDTEIGKHEFSGFCDPGVTGTRLWKTFSVGIFQLIPKKDRKGRKKGKVKVRVYGEASNPGAVYERAREICYQLDVGTYDGPKNVRVK